MVEKMADDTPSKESGAAKDGDELWRVLGSTIGAIRAARSALSNAPIGRDIVIAVKLLFAGPVRPDLALPVVVRGSFQLLLADAHDVTTRFSS